MIIIIKFLMKGEIICLKDGASEKEDTSEASPKVGTEEASQKVDTGEASPKKDNDRFSENDVEPLLKLLVDINSSDDFKLRKMLSQNIETSIKDKVSKSTYLFKGTIYDRIAKFKPIFAKALGCRKEEIGIACKSQMLGLESQDRDGFYDLATFSSITNRNNLDPRPWRVLIGNWKWNPFVSNKQTDLVVIGNINIPESDSTSVLTSDSIDPSNSASASVDNSALVDTSVSTSASVDNSASIDTSNSTSASISGSNVTFPKEMLLWGNLTNSSSNNTNVKVDKLETLDMSGKILGVNTGSATINQIAPESFSLETVRQWISNHMSRENKTDGTVEYTGEDLGRVFKDPQSFLEANNESIIEYLKEMTRIDQEQHTLDDN